METISQMLNHMVTWALSQPDPVVPSLASNEGDAPSPLPAPKPVVWQPEYHTNYELAFLHAGECTMFVRGNVFRLAPGTFCLIPHGKVHYEAPLATQQPYHLVWISVEHRRARVFSSMYGSPTRHHLVRPGTVAPLSERTQSALDSLYWELVHRTDRADGDGAVTARYLASFLNTISEAVPPAPSVPTDVSTPPHPTNSAADDGDAAPLIPSQPAQGLAANDGDDPDKMIHLIQQAYTYIENNFTSPHITVDDIAAQVALSPDYFAAQFRQGTGIAPYQLVIQKRMHGARHLLAATNVSITDIARQLGYESPYHFSRMFRRFQGVSPTQFRLDNVASHADDR